MKTLLTATAITLVCSVALSLETDPIPGVDVKVGKHPKKPVVIVAQGSTDANGTVTFKDLADGTYFVRITVGGATYEVTGNDAGEQIQAIGARTARRAPSKPKVFAKKFDEFSATIEVLDNSIKVSLGKQLNAQQSKRR